MVPAPPIVPAAHDVAAGASRAIDKHDVSTTSKFDVASLSSSRIDASEMPATRPPHALDALDALAAADAADEQRQHGRDSAPFLPPPPNNRGAVKLPGIAPIAPRGAAAGDDLAAQFGAAGATSAAWSDAALPPARRGRLRELVGSPRRIAIAAGALVVVIVGLVFAFGGGDARPSKASGRDTPAVTDPAGPSNQPAGAKAEPPAGTRPDDTAGTEHAGTESSDAAGTEHAGTESSDTAGTEHEGGESSDTTDTAGTASGDTAGTASGDTAGTASGDTAGTAPDDTAGTGPASSGPAPGATSAPADHAAHVRSSTTTSSDTTETTPHPIKHVVKPATKRLSTKPVIRKTTKPAVKTAPKKWDPDSLFPTKKKKK